MVELRNERIQQMLREETPKTEEVKTILRCVYTRYMRLFEKYFADIDALNDDRIAELKQYFEETGSLVKYYYMDIPQDICEGLSMFDNAYIAELLGPNWHKYIFDSYKNFRGAMEKQYRVCKKRPNGGGTPIAMIVGIRLREEELGEEEGDGDVFKPLEDEKADI